MMTIFLTVVITIIACYLIYELLVMAIVANNGIIDKKELMNYKKLFRNLKVNPNMNNVLQDFGGDIDRHTLISNCPSLIFSYFIFTENGVFGILRWSKIHKITKVKFNEMYNNNNDGDKRELLLEDK